MIPRYRGCAGLVLILAFLGQFTSCASPAGQGETRPLAAHHDENLASGLNEPLEPQPAEPPPGRPATRPPPAADGDDIIQFKPRPGDVTYYLIEREVRDMCGFPPLLTVTVVVKEKRYITQRVLDDKNPQDATPPAGEGSRISWECERYEVRERGLKDETVFDSLRDLYPPPSLWALGDIPGSVCTFTLDPLAGTASDIKIQRAPVAGSAGAAKLSRAAERCALNVDNLKKLIEDLGAFYFPTEPQQVGNKWNKSYQEDQKNLGVVDTALTCTLRSVCETEGRRIGAIDLSSEITLENQDAAAGEKADSAARRPTSSLPSAKDPKYKLDKAKCQGAVDFDLDAGELVKLNLFRELEWVAEIEPPATQSSTLMVKEIRLGSAEDIRVTASHTPPVMPVIVGGKKPPIVPDAEKAKIPSSQPASTSTAHGQPSGPHAPATERGPAATRPTAPTTRPAATTGPGASRPTSSAPEERRPVERRPGPRPLPKSHPDRKTHGQNGTPKPNPNP